MCKLLLNRSLHNSHGLSSTSFSAVIISEQLVSFSSLSNKFQRGKLVELGSMKEGNKNWMTKMEDTLIGHMEVLIQQIFERR